jgi:cytochrome b561
LDVNMSVNPMLQAAPQSRNGTGDAQAAIIQNGGLDERNARRLKRGHALDRYDGVARFFHWVFAAGIIYASIAGYTLAQLSRGPERDFLSRLNMSIATVLIVLFPLRVCWKFMRIEPRALAGVSSIQLTLAHRVHILIYLTIFAVLASGFLMIPNGYSFFGLIEIHTPFVKGPLTDKLFVIHRASCALLAGLVVLHVLAVVKHQLIARNDVLRRML